MFVATKKSRVIKSRFLRVWTGFPRLCCELNCGKNMSSSALFLDDDQVGWIPRFCCGLEDFVMAEEVVHGGVELACGAAFGEGV